MIKRVTEGMIETGEMIDTDQIEIGDHLVMIDIDLVGIVSSRSFLKDSDDRDDRRDRDKRRRDDSSERRRSRRYS